MANPKTLAERVAVLERVHEDYRADIRELGETMRELVRDLGEDSRRDTDKISKSVDKLSEIVTQGKMADVRHDHEIGSLKQEQRRIRKRQESIDESADLAVMALSSEPRDPRAPARALGSDARTKAAIATVLVALAGAITAAINASGG